MLAARLGSNLEVVEARQVDEEIHVERREAAEREMGGGGERGGDSESERFRPVAAPGLITCSMRA